MSANRPNDSRESLANETVATLMRANFISAAPDDSLLEADRIMRLARIRHLPVVKNGVLVGLISHRDVLSASIAKLEKSEPSERLDHLRSISIGQVMQRELETAVEATSLAAAARRTQRPAPRGHRDRE
jgi:CBS domain-containing membrane protein